MRDIGAIRPLSTSTGLVSDDVGSSGWSTSMNTSSPRVKRAASAELIPTSTLPRIKAHSDPRQTQVYEYEPAVHDEHSLAKSAPVERSISPPPTPTTPGKHTPKMQ